MDQLTDTWNDMNFGSFCKQFGNFLVPLQILDVDKGLFQVPFIKQEINDTHYLIYSYYKSLPGLGIFFAKC
jgi:hypothetical protein